MKIFLLKILKYLKKIIEILILNLYPNVNFPPRRPNNYHRFFEEEVEASYQYFKRFFPNCIFLSQKEIRDFAINKSLENIKFTDQLLLEFGVWKGETLNLFSSKIGDKKIYGFDSFEGLRDNWIGTAALKGEFNVRGLIPKLNKNAIPVKGWVQDTLPDFLKTKKEKIQFLHMDLDTFESSKFVLSLLKERFQKGTIIIFDQLYNYSGWKSGEFKALQETLSEEQYRYLAFSTDNCQAVIEIIKV